MCLHQCVRVQRCETAHWMHRGKFFFVQYLAYFIVHKQCSKRSFVQLVPGMWQTCRGIEHATERSAVEHNSHIGKSLVQTTLMILCRWN